MSSGKIFALVLEAEGAILKWGHHGATDPKKAAPGTIRHDLGTSIGNNCTHGSDLRNCRLRNQLLLLRPRTDLIFPRGHPAAARHPESPAPSGVQDLNRQIRLECSEWTPPRTWPHAPPLGGLLVLIGALLYFAANSPSASENFLATSSTAANTTTFYFPSSPAFCSAPVFLFSSGFLDSYASD